MKKRSLDEVIHEHLTEKGDFNEIAKTLVDEKICEIVPFLEDKDIITLSYGTVNGRLCGYFFISPKKNVKITSDEIKKAFRLSPEIVQEKNEIWNSALEAICNAYRKLPNRSQYFVTSIGLGDLEFTTSM